MDSLTFKQVFSFLEYQEARKGNFFLEVKGNDKTYIIYKTNTIKCLSLFTLNDISPIDILIENIGDISILSSLEFSDNSEYEIEKICTQDQIIQYLCGLMILDTPSDNVLEVCKYYENVFFKNRDNNYSLVLTDKRNRLLNVISFDKENYNYFFENNTAFWNSKPALETNKYLIAFNPYILLSFLKTERDYNIFVFTTKVTASTFSIIFQKYNEENQYTFLYNNKTELYAILNIISFALNMKGHISTVCRNSTDIIFSIFSNDYNELLQYSQKVADMQKVFNNIIENYSKDINFKSDSTNFGTNQIFNIICPDITDAIGLLCSQLIKSFNLNIKLVYG